jgi:hypothetical protein
MEHSVPGQEFVLGANKMEQGSKIYAGREQGNQIYFN